MAWVKAYFRIPDSGESTEFVDEVTGFRRAYFKATFKDNPALPADYERQLLDMPAAQRKAYLLGDWSAYVGQVFDEWDYNLHVCAPFPIPAEWEIWRGCDDGFAAPAACLWLAHDDIHDRVYVIAELYQRGLTPEALAHAVLRIDRTLQLSDAGDLFENDLPLSGIIDSAAFAEIGLGTSGGKGSRGDIMNTHGCKWKPSEKGVGSRLAGIAAIHTRLALKRDGRPGLIVFNTCRNLIRTLPAMVYSRSNPEDIDDSCEQHGVDALRYALTRKKITFRLRKVVF
jgi:hypothetical protein